MPMFFAVPAIMRMAASSELVLGWAFLILIISMICFFGTLATRSGCGTGARENRFPPGLTLL